MAATSHPTATLAAVEVLRGGGNALDAAIAAGAVQCVTEPQSTGIGGDCFLLYFESSSGRLHGLNGSGRSPAAADPSVFAARGLEVIPEYDILAVTVPGAVHAWHTALERFGTRSLGELLQPAIRYAEEGFAVTPVVGSVWANHVGLLARSASTARAFLPGGAAPAVGSRFGFPHLARSLRLIAEQGPGALHGGEIGEAVARFVGAQGGLLTLEDLAAHRSDWVEPIRTNYRGLDVCELPPNGQGIAALITLNVLESAGIERHERLGADHVHLVTEAFRLAVAERDTWVGDPAAGRLPVSELLDPGFAAGLAGRIRPGQALPSTLSSALPAAGNTVYLSVVDEDGNCCSYINSLYHPYGSGIVAGDTGILLQNRGAGFVLEEGHVNCIGPRKRPMHTIIPAMALRNGLPALCFGVMGGHYQAMGHAYVLSNVLDFGLDVQEAIDAPRFLPVGTVLTVERHLPRTVCAAMQQWGYEVIVSEGPMGGAQVVAIDRDRGVLQGGSDPRKDGCAMGY